MKKEEFRKKYLDLRKSIIDRKIKDSEILNELLSLKCIKDAKLILTYVSFDSEVDTIQFIKEMLKFKLVAVPRVEGNRMNFYLISSMNDLQQGTYGILEPTNQNLVKDFSDSCCIVPGICFNEDGYRIGYGGGYYDHFLANYPGYTIGLCYHECLISEKFQEVHDVKVKMIVYK